MKKVIQGDLLRQYLLKNSIKASHLYSLLKKKGVLVKSKKKSALVPFFLKSIIDAELLMFIEQSEEIKSKEPKFTNASIKVKNDFEIKELCNINLNLQNELVDRNEFKLNYNIVNVPQFVIEKNDKDDLKVSMDIELEIENQLENYNSTTIKRNAKIDIILEQDNLIINKNYTSPETKEVLDYVVEKIRSFLKEEQFIDKNSDFISVKFHDFSDIKRVNFLKSFQYIKNEIFTYKSIVDIEIEYVKKGKTIDRLLDNISSMKIKGDNLDNHPFLQEEKYFSKVIINGLKIKYDFDFELEKGAMILNLSFPDLDIDSEEENLSNPNFEFSINLLSSLHKENSYKIINGMALIIEGYKNDMCLNFRKDDKGE